MAAAAKRHTNNNEVQISLLPDRKEGTEFVTRIYGVLIAIIVLLILGIGTSSFFLHARSTGLRQQTAAITESMQKINQDLGDATARAVEVGNLGQRAGVAKSVLENHVASEKALAFFETSTVPEVTLGNLAFDAAGKMVVTGRGEQFSSVVRQLQSWKENPDVASVSMSGISVAVDRVGNIGGVDFTATIQLGKGALRFKP